MNLSYFDRLAGVDLQFFGGLARDTAEELLGSEAALGILLLALIGTAGILWLIVLMMVRIGRRLFVRRRPVPDRTERVQGLARLGARPAEIARAVGLSRDAISLIMPDASSGRIGTKVPPSARSAGNPRLAAPGQRRLTHRATA